jgi:hypothetical protein
MKFHTLGAAAFAAFATLGHAGTSHAVVLLSQHVPGYCFDINMNTKRAALWNCHGGANQNFTFSGYGAMKVGGECLDTQGEGKPLALTACRDTRSQRWGFDQARRQFKNEEGWCADIEGGRRDRGTPVIAWRCSDAAVNQRWSQGRVLPIAQAGTLGLNPTQLQKLQGADQLINRNGGSIVGNAGGNIVAAGAGNIVAAGGGNIVAAGGLN